MRNDTEVKSLVESLTSELLYRKVDRANTELVRGALIGLQYCLGNDDAAAVIANMHQLSKMQEAKMTVADVKAGSQATTSLKAALDNLRKAADAVPSSDATASEDDEDKQAMPAPVKRGPGRPRKNPEAPVAPPKAAAPPVKKPPEPDDDDEDDDDDEAPPPPKKAVAAPPPAPAKKPPPPVDDDEDEEFQFDDEDDEDEDEAPPPKKPAPKPAAAPAAPAKKPPVDDDDDWDDDDDDDDD